MRASNLTIAALYLLIVSLFGYMVISNARAANQVKAQSETFYKKLSGKPINVLYVDGVESIDQKRFPRMWNQAKTHLLITTKDIPNLQLSGDTLCAKGFFPDAYFDKNTFRQFIIRQNDGKTTSYSADDIKNMSAN